MINKITFSIKNVIKLKPEVVEINLVEKEKYISEVKKICKLHKEKTRTIHSANLDKPKIILYHIGQYKYYDEKDKKTKYITEKIPDVLGKRRHDKTTMLKTLEPVLRNEMTIQYASQQAKNLLNLTTVPSTIWRWVDVFDIDKNAYMEMEKKVVENFTGHISIDEVYDNGDGIIIATDPVSDTILIARLLDGKPKNEDIETALLELKKRFKNVKTCTKDGSPLYINTVKKVFPLVLLQICIFHLVKMLLKYFLRWHREIRKQIKSDDLPGGLKCVGTKLKKYLFQNRNLFVKKKLSAKERDRLKTIYATIPEFYDLRRLFLKFIKIFSAYSLDETLSRFWKFLSEPVLYEKMPGLVKQILKYYKSNELFTYLLFDKKIRKKIRTTNHTERTNRKFRKKQKTHYRIRKTTRREKMLIFMLYFHNAKSLGLGSQVILILLLFQRLRIFVNLFKKIFPFQKMLYFYHINILHYNYIFKYYNVRLFMIFRRNNDETFTRYYFFPFYD